MGTTQHEAAEELQGEDDESSPLLLNNGKVTLPTKTSLREKLNKLYNYEEPIKPVNLNRNAQQRMIKEFKRRPAWKKKAKQNKVFLKAVAEVSALENSNTFVALPDGRKLGYCIYGRLMTAKDEKNITHIIFLHGTPGSRFFFLPEWETVALKYNCCFHVLERPGFGNSTEKFDHSPESYAEDILAYTDMKEIEQFYLMGYSAGTPYAAVGLYKIPKTRLLGVCLVAAICDAPGATKSMTHESAFAWRYLLKHRRLLYYLIRPSKAKLKRPVSLTMKNHFDTTVDKYLFLKYPQIVRVFAHSWHEQFKDTGRGARAEATNYFLFKSGWDEKFLSFDGNHHNKVLIFCGAQDKRSTKEMSEHLHRIIPNSKLKVKDHSAHLVIFEYFEEMVHDLTMPVL